MAAPALSVAAIGKSYGRNRVLDEVSFEVMPGETAALLGENGAGKSTLAKIIAGSIGQDEGELTVAGERVRFANPREALDHGVAFIPQELVYVPRLTVAENICLGRARSRLGFTSPGGILRQARADADALGFDLPLRETMDSIPLVQQQLVEILKAFARQSRVVLLDEPTAALESEDSDHLLGLTAQLAARGVAVVYISHRIDEVFRSCDTVHVLRGGSLVQSQAIAETTPREVISSMLGRPADEVVVPKRQTGPTPNALVVNGWNRAEAPVLDDVSFTVEKGEIVGLYGVRGAGPETIAETLGGLHPGTTGGTEVLGSPIGDLGSPIQAQRAGIAYVPADRKSQGLVLLNSITHALSLPTLSRLTRFGWIRAALERRTASDLAQRTRVRSQSLAQPVGELSGGNQQKVLVGSRLAADAGVLVLHEPTRGVDVGARLEIHRLLRELADQGAAELLVTSDIEEAVILSDRLLIMRQGRIVHEISKPGLGSQSEALQHAGGTQ
ncbi:sugar ABC transporter ATP-binding protein [Herbiconiux daphne]|uniref:Sugar ABC transporter ATP-binding protein n=1 Tax=Herbiconiux daphne TaxID=2970914 RepID=A0ABT2H3J4_9MICO|nr:sugar ABC transporter ATP-binding protein [Herbiconiux daphne]MCS5734497.1 sugar ABC transporter ATP-binding protein [Herbiconiux daphne]